MLKEVGSRGFNFIDYSGVCILSGVDCNLFSHLFKNSNSIILRQDFVDFCYEFLSYKIGLTERTQNVVLSWTKDVERYPTRVYRDSLNSDFDSTVKILNVFGENFKVSTIKKIG